ncbi:MAG: M50 family metallopeptidase [bacterium]|nr:M50 family metallopeptidase [bacterium]
MTSSKPDAGHGVSLLKLGLILLAILFFWNSWLVYPLKVLVVFFHELSHGLAALLTGGSIVEIQLQKQQGGLCITQGGSRFVILTAGYLGSLLFGGAILLLAARSKDDKVIVGTLAAILLVVTLVWVRPWFGFGMIFGLGSAGVLALAAAYFSKDMNDGLLRVIGLVSCFYAVLDIKSDVLDRPEAKSDAHMLAELTGIPTIVWGLLWITIAVVLTYFFLKASSSMAPEDESASPTTFVG